MSVVPIPYWLILAAAFLVRYLPVRLSYWVASLMGDVTYYLWWEGRANTIHNMRRVLGPEAPASQVRRTARHSFRNYLKTLVDFLRLPTLDQQELDGLVEASGWEHLDAALEQGKGVLMVGVHFGNWDLAGLALAMRSYPINAVADSFRSERLNRLVLKTRQARGIKIIPLGYALRRIYRALKGNEIVALVFDRPALEDGVLVRFFGQPALWPAGPAILALRTGAPLIVGYLVRRPDNTFTGQMQPLSLPKTSGDTARDVQALTQKMVNVFEGFIRRYPDQWYMFRPMWPQGETSRELELDRVKGL
ncbi:MAG: lysophospholipid acyltransferase family protein [Anaerolineae bacterium]